MKTLLIAILTTAACAAGEDEPPNIRVCTQSIEVPHSALTAWLDGDTQSGDAIREKAIALVQKGEASIVETTILASREGDRASLESVAEEIYPTESDAWDLPPAKGFEMKWNYPTLRAFYAFETKNAGVSMEIEPSMDRNGRGIHVRVLTEQVDRLRLDTWHKHEDRYGDASMRWPIYGKLSVKTRLLMAPGKWELAGVHSPLHPEPSPALPRRIMQFVRADLVNLDGTSP